MPQFRTMLLIGAIAVVAAVGAIAFTVLRTPEAATTPITAIPLASTSESAAASPSASASTAPSASTTASTAASASPAATESIAAEASPAASSGGEVVVATIVQDESEARFVIDEVLNNAPKTVVGTTNQVAGEIAIDTQNPSNTQVGVIQVNARTLVTDNDFRNRAIKNQILDTNNHEFITFTPTQISGLPDSGAIGQTYTFQVTGDLTIRDVTKSVMFDVTATPVSDTRLEGKAQTTIKYADWNIRIPQVRQVASVSDDVRLEIDFVAVPK